MTNKKHKYTMYFILLLLMFQKVFAVETTVASATDGNNGCSISIVSPTLAFNSGSNTYVSSLSPTSMLRVEKWERSGGYTFWVEVYDGSTETRIMVGDSRNHADFPIVNNQTYRVQLRYKKWEYGKWHTSRTITTTIRLDANNPTVPPFSFSVPETEKVNGWFNKESLLGESLSLTADPYDTGGSGFKSGSWNPSPNTEIIDNQIKVLREGTTIVTYNAYDRVGRSDNREETIKIDISSPDPVSNTTSSFEEKFENAPNLLGFKFDWESVHDNPTGDEVGIDFSGIGEYVLKLSTKDDYIDGTEISIAKGDNSNIEFNDSYKIISLETGEYTGDISREIVYYPSLYAVDIAGNKSAVSNFEPFLVPRPAEIEDLKSYDIDSQDVTKPYYQNGTVIYPLELTAKFSPMSVDDVFHINNIQLYVKDSLDTESEWVSVGNPLVVPSKELLEYDEDTNHYYKKYQIQLEGKEHAHKSYEYKLETIHNFLKFDDEGNTSPFTESYETVILQTPNFELSRDDIIFELFTDNGDLSNPFSMINGNGQEVILKNGQYISTERNISFINESVIFRAVNLLNDESEYLDPEGDLIRFTLSSDDLGLLESDQESISELDGQKLRLDSELIPPAPVVISELTVPFSISVIDDPDPLDTDGVKFPYANDINFVLQKDVSIDNDFTSTLVHKLNTDKTLDAYTPTNKLAELKLSIGKIFENQSGIKNVIAYTVQADEFTSKITSDNIETNQSIYSELITESKIDLTFVITDDEGNQIYESSDLILDSNADTDTNYANKYILIKIEDYAGNYFYRHHYVPFDETEPETPILRYVHDENSIGITAEFPLGEITDGYLYDWDYPDLIDNGISVTVDTTGMGVNALYDIPLTITDKAGNSTSLAGQFCTYADLTDLLPSDVSDSEVSDELDELYDSDYPENTAHYLSWELIPSATSTSYYMERIKGENDVQALEAEESPSLVVLTDSNLRPHETYDYNLYPVNHLGEVNREDSISFSRTLKNNAPFEVEILSPLNESYTTADPKFVFYYNNDEMIGDSDGDEVIYSAYIRKGLEEFELINADFADNEEGVGWAIDFNPADLSFSLEHDQVYTWKIVSRDVIDSGSEYIFPSENADEYLPKEVSSAMGTFTADTEFPEITNLQFGDENLLYHSSNLFSFNISDLGSGVENETVYVKVITDESEESLPASEIEEELYSVQLPDGSYNIEILASDSAGNKKIINKNDIWVDTEAPQISGTFSIDSENSGQVITASNLLELSITATDQVTDIQSISYEFKAEESESGFSGSIDVSVMDPEDNLYVVSIPFTSAINRQIYSLHINVLDKAGNSSLVHTNSALTLMRDLTPPKAEIALTGGFTSAAGGMYVSNLGDLETDVQMDVDKYGITSSRYGLKNWETGEISNWSTSISSLLSSVNLIDGNRYSLAIEVENYLGLTGGSLSEVFIYDDSAPTSVNLTGISSEPYVSGETFRVEVSGTDTHSTITEYSLSIGNGFNPTLVTERLNGQRDGFLVKDTGDGTVFSFAIPELTGDLTNGSYSIKLVAKNGAGLSTAYSAGNLVIDNSQDKVIVSDSLLFSSDVSSISGRWRYNGEKTVTTFKYALLEASLGRQPLESEWVYTENESVSLFLEEGEYLTHGEIYKFYVQAYYDDETYSSIASNSGVTIDTSAASFAEELVSPDYSLSKDMWIQWNVSDDQSDIQSIEAIIEKLTYDSEGKILYTDDVIPQPVYDRLAEIDLPLVNSPDRVFINTDRYGRALDLETGDHVYITIRVTNGSGLITDRISKVVIIDDSAPPTPLVMDSGDSIKPTELVIANWLWTKDDPESGNVGYQWQVYNGEIGVDPDKWSEISELKDLSGIGTYEQDFNGSNDDLYYIAVKATNGVGLETIGVSNGIHLDNQAPDMVEVILTGTSGSEDLRYINRKDNLVLKINAVDNDEIKDYTWSYGMFDEYTQWTEVQAEQLSTSNEIEFELKDEITNGNILTFKTAVRDKSDNISSVGYSKGVMYDSTEPEVFNINGYLSGDILRYDWDSRHVLAPIVSYSYTLKKLINVDTESSEVVQTGVLFENSFSIDVSDPEFEDNYYVLEVIALSEAANSSSNELSNIVMVDKSAPVVTDFINNRFTSTKVNFDITAQEPTSRITEFQYAVGTFESPNTISGKWQNVVTGANHISRTFLFADLPGGNDSVIDGTELLVRVRVKNSAGLWSPVYLGKPILVDKTPAIVENIDVSRTLAIGEVLFDLDRAYTSDGSQIDKINALSTDEQSGIKSYQLGFAQGSNVLFWGPIVSTGSTADDILKTFDESELSVNGYTLEHDLEYSVAFRAYNGSGDPSNTAFSNLVLADLVAPQIQFNLEASHSSPGNLHQETITDDLIQLISNGENVIVAYTLAEDTSESVFIEFDLLLPTGGEEDPASIIELEPASFENTYLFTKTDSDGYGIYQIIARLTDAAGNYVDEGDIQSIRLNSPPQITLEDNLTTPGKPLTFRLDEAANDDDGIESCYWIFGNDEETDLTEYTTQYSHKELWDSETDYPLYLRAIDKYGKSNEKWVNMKVLNTSIGTLYMDEYWSGDHTITGLVEVPEGLILNIQDDANIYSFNTPEEVEDVGLLINGTLNAGDNIDFTIHADLSEYFWHGIYVNGTANIGQSDISRAIRGLTATSGAEVGLLNTSFTQNNIGVHVVSNIIILSDLTFTENYEYAIKEDGLAVPNVLGCQFTDNTYDYYDTVLTAIDFEMLNELSSNTGNTGN